VAALLIVEDNTDLANLLSSVGEMRGHLTRVANSGAEALVALGQQRFEAAIVDLFLPDMESPALLERFRSANVPVFAMSGVFKGPSFALEVMEKHGAAAFFEKPFPILELMRQIETMTGLPAPRPPPPPDEAFDVALEVTVQESEADADPAPQQTRPPVDLPPIDAWERSWKSDAEAKPVRKRSVERSGSLKTTNVPHLLNACYQARLRGDLLLKQGQKVKVVSLEAGQAVYAASNLASERFARFCARKGLLPVDDLDAVAQLAKEEGLKTGDAMVRLGIVTEPQRRGLLEDQVKEIIWSTFGWTDGEYGFAPDKPLKDGVVKISVFPGQLILDGCQKTPLVQLREAVPPELKLVPAADPPYHLEQLAFSGEQAKLIAWADGTKTVGDLLALSDLEERDALALLYGLLQTGLVEKRSEKQRRVSFGF
jgi:CheY-like chemotaxis protein